MSTMRQNGAFAYPPQMVRAACEFVLYSYATLLLPLLPKRNRELYAEVTKDLPAQPLSREFRRIEQRIPVDLSGLPKHYPVEKMKGFFRQLLVIVYEDQLRGVGGSLGVNFEGSNKGKLSKIALMVDLKISKLSNRHIPNTKEQYLQIKEELCGVVRHELQHFVQALLAMATGSTHIFNASETKKGTGIPKEYYGLDLKAIQQEMQKGAKIAATGGPALSPLEQTQLQKVNEYALTAVEFFPFVSDSIARLLASAGTQSGRRRITKEMVRAVTEQQQTKDGVTPYFVRALKTYAKPLYRRFMAELYSFANNFNEKEAEKERAAKRPINASRVIAAVLEDLDRERSSRAGYLRLNRQHFLDYAQAELAAQGP